MPAISAQAHIGGAGWHAAKAVGPRQHTVGGATGGPLPAADKPAE